MPKTKREKAMQRALLQYRNPKKYDIVYEALVEAGREDLIGFGPKCLIKPKEGSKNRSFTKDSKNKEKHLQKGKCMSIKNGNQSSHSKTNKGKLKTTTPKAKTGKRKK